MTVVGVSTPGDPGLWVLVQWFEDGWWVAPLGSDRVFPPESAVWIPFPNGWQLDTGLA